MRHLLLRLGFSYIKSKVVPGKADSEKQKVFVQAYDVLKEDLGEPNKIFFVEAPHPLRNGVAGYGWVPKG